MLNRALTLFIICLTAQLYAGTYYRSPFSIGIGAREIGLGGAAVAGRGGASAIFWNPALLSKTDRNEIHLFHTSLFMDTRYENVAAVFPTTSAGAFAFGVTNLSSGDFVRYQSNYGTDGTFSTRQNQLELAYGFLPINSIGIGLAVKGTMFDIDRYRDSGFGFDIGISYNPAFIGGLTAGIKVADIYGPRIRLNQTEQRFPYAIRAGLGYDKSISNAITSAINIDIEKLEKGKAEIFAGAEIGLSKLVFLRAGYLADRVTFGAGLAYSMIQFDYAFVPMNELGSSHRLSLIFSFGPSVEKRRLENRRKAVGEELERIDRIRAEEKQARIDSLMRSAAAFESENQLSSAIDCYYRVLGLDDQNAAAIEKSSTLIEKLQYQLGKSAGDQFVAGLVSKQLELSGNYLSKKQYDRAIEQLDFALLLDPQNKAAQEMRSNALAEKSAAISSLKTTLRSAISTGDNLKALQTIQEILRLDPEDREANDSRQQIVKSMEASRHLDNALRLFDQEQYQKASASADSALAINPRFEGARNLKRRLAQFTAKETTLEDIKKNPEHWNIYLEGMDKYQAGEYERALKLWQSLLEYYPNNPNLKRNIEQATERAGKR